MEDFNSYLYPLLGTVREEVEKFLGWDVDESVLLKNEFWKPDLTELDHPCYDILEDCLPEIDITEFKFEIEESTRNITYREVLVEDLENLNEKIAEHKDEYSDSEFSDDDNIPCEHVNDVNNDISSSESSDSESISSESSEETTPVNSIYKILDLQEVENINLHKRILDQTFTNSLEMDSDLSGVSNDDVIECLKYIQSQTNELYALKLEQSMSTFSIDYLVEQRTTWAAMITPATQIKDFRILYREFPFELDHFQKSAIYLLQHQRDVIVAAHTSAGKTVIAEYAIAMAQKRRNRVIYTSPIKALSNQKYADFKKTFKDVGIMTGDFKINTLGSCIVMTTEILRSLLYSQNSPQIRDLEFVIFDEVHYINDMERGYVWEEVMILLPPSVKLVLLSATVPNTMELADWLGKIKQRVVYVIATYHRPVPLNYFISHQKMSGNKSVELLPLLNENKIIIRNSIKEVSKELEKCKSRTYEKLAINLIKHLEKVQQLPAVFFLFSRNYINTLALEVAKFVDLTDATEKAEVENVSKKIIDNILSKNCQLRQVKFMEMILKKGIAVHHSGILPILKEMVELFFQAGLVKILFATETFSTGLNMPTKTVVFYELTKFDTNERRLLNGSEFIQMAGRAGRRGIDKTGTVIILGTPKTIKDNAIILVLEGTAQKLESKFRVTYKMILTLLSNETLAIESMMKMNFLEAGRSINIKELKEKRDKLKANFEHESREHPVHDYEKYRDICDKITNYLQLKQHLLKKISIYPIFTECLKFAALLRINCKQYIYQLAYLLKRSGSELTVVVLKDASYDETIPDLDYYLRSKEIISYIDNAFNPYSDNGFDIIKISTDCIIDIINENLGFVNKIDIKKIEDFLRKETQKYRKKEKIPKIIDLFSGLRTLSICDDLDKLNFLKNQIIKLLNIANIHNDYAQIKKVLKLKLIEDEIVNINYEISHESSTLYPEYATRLKLLKHFNFVDENNLVTVKGKVASKMPVHELIITELIFSGTLNDYLPHELAAIFTIFGYQQKSKTESKVNVIDRLKPLLDHIIAILTNIEDVQIMYQIPDRETILYPTAVMFMYNFALGDSFHNSLKFIEGNDKDEGNLIRCIHTTYEILRRVAEAAALLNDKELEDSLNYLFKDTRKDVPFAPSLYTLCKGKQENK